MKKILVLSILLLLSACSVEVGKFSPERHAQYELNHPDCEKNPERCISGVAW